jgi:hypothetical protein
LPALIAIPTEALPAYRRRKALILIWQNVADPQGRTPPERYTKSVARILYNVALVIEFVMAGRVTAPVAAQADLTGAEFRIAEILLKNGEFVFARWRRFFMVRFLYLIPRGTSVSGSMRCWLRHTRFRSLKRLVMTDERERVDRHAAPFLEFHAPISALFTQKVEFLSSMHLSYL